MSKVFSEDQISVIKDLSDQQLSEYLKCENTDVTWVLLGVAVIAGVYMFLIMLAWIFPSIPFWIKVLITGVLVGSLLYLFSRVS